MKSYYALWILLIIVIIIAFAVYFKVNKLEKSLLAFTQPIINYNSYQKTINYSPTINLIIDKLEGNGNAIGNNNKVENQIA